MIHMTVSTIGGILVFHVFRLIPLQTHGAKKEHMERAQLDWRTLATPQPNIAFHRHAFNTLNSAAPEPELDAPPVTTASKVEETDEKLIRKIWILS